MILAPTVLKAFQTCAPEARRWIVSAPDVLRPTARPLKSGFKGLVQSMTIFPTREPHCVMASSTAPQGVVSTTTSAAQTASATVSTDAVEPISRARS